VLAPGEPGDPTQIIDARDLARFAIKTIEENITGIYNTVGPESPLTWAEFLYGIRAVTRARVGEEIGETIPSRTGEVGGAQDGKAQHR
jgi:hypothetical protein